MNWNEASRENTVYGESRAFVIEGDAVAKARPRIRRDGRTYTPKRTVEYEQKVRGAYKEAYPDAEVIDEALELTVTFFVKIPQSWSKTKQEQARAGVIMPTSRPDVDNLIKPITDALNGICYVDDSQIIGIDAMKRYSDFPRTEVLLKKVKGRSGTWRWL